MNFTIAPILLLFISFSVGTTLVFNNQTTLCSSASSPCKFSNPSIWNGVYSPPTKNDDVQIAADGIFMVIDEDLEINALYVDANNSAITIDNAHVILTNVRVVWHLPTSWFFDCNLTIQNNSTLKADFPVFSVIAVRDSSSVLGNTVVLTSLGLYNTSTFRFGGFFRDSVAQSLFVTDNSQFSLTSETANGNQVANIQTEGNAKFNVNGEVTFENEIGADSNSKNYYRFNSIVPPQIGTVFVLLNTPIIEFSHGASIGYLEGSGSKYSTPVVITNGTFNCKKISNIDVSLSNVISTLGDLSDYNNDLEGVNLVLKASKVTLAYQRSVMVNLTDQSVAKVIGDINNVWADEESQIVVYGHTTLQDDIKIDGEFVISSASQSTFGNVDVDRQFTFGSCTASGFLSTLALNWDSSVTCVKTPAGTLEFSAVQMRTASLDVKSASININGTLSAYVSSVIKAGNISASVVEINYDNTGVAVGLRFNITGDVHINRNLSISNLGGQTTFNIDGELYINEGCGMVININPNELTNKRTSYPLLSAKKIHGKFASFVGLPDPNWVVLYSESGLSMQLQSSTPSKDPNWKWIVIGVVGALVLAVIVVIVVIVVRRRNYSHLK